MKILFIALIACVIFCYQCESVELECEYELHYYGAYECIVKNLELTSNDDREISSIRGQHLDGKSDSDVKEFGAAYKVMKYLPRGLTKFFENIEKVEIVNVWLEEVSKEDLKQFGGNLKILRFTGTKIEKIDADLFEFNPNLEFIDLGVNQIKHIGDGAFNGLEKLQTLVISANPCTDWDYEEVYETRSKILEQLKEVEARCKDLSFTTVKP